MRSDGDHLKCRLEVVVDDVAEVVIHGDTAELRTISGQRAEWRRFICSQPLPANPVDFRFTGIDGRGRQTLVREPRHGGPAVIRIEDSKGGREGYTFDIEWRGEMDRGRDDRDRGEVRRPDGRWTGALGGEFQYRGDGRGLLDRRNGRDIPVRDVVVSLNRDGRVVLEFEARDFRRVVFAGQARSITTGRVEAELTSGAGDRDARGVVTIFMDRGGEVERVSMRGRIDRDPFTLEWSAR